MTRVLDEIELDRAAVAAGATFGEAARVLRESGATMVAVVDDAERVVGLFGAEEALRGLLPGYLRDLHHTAFARDDARLLGERARTVRDEPVERHCAKPVTVESDSSGLHVGEVFLHCRLPAVAVVARGRFVGILDRGDFARALGTWAERPSN